MRTKHSSPQSRAPQYRIICIFENSNACAEPLDTRMAVRVLDIERHSAREMGVQCADRFEHRYGNIICKGRFVGRQVVENGAAQASCLFPKTQFGVSAKNGVIGRTLSEIAKNGLNEFVELCGFVSDIPLALTAAVSAAERPRCARQIVRSVFTRSWPRAKSWRTSG